MLLQCSKLTDIRRDLFNSVRKCCPWIDLLNDENKFIYLLNSSGSVIKGTYVILLSRKGLIPENLILTQEHLLLLSLKRNSYLQGAIVLLPF